MKTLWMAVALFGCCVIPGCGGGSLSSSKPPSVSAWAGTYSGTLNFKGCPTTGTCIGDSISITITQPTEQFSPSEFSSTLGITGTDMTTKTSITGGGTPLFVGPAPMGPGTNTTSADATFGDGTIIFFAASGSSSTKTPILIQTIQVMNTVTVGKQVERGSAYYGTLTRQ